MTAKQPAPLFLWMLLLLSGVLCGVAFFFNKPFFLPLLLVTVILVSVMVTLFFIHRTLSNDLPRTGKNSEVHNHDLPCRIASDAKKAVDAYLSSVNRKGLFRKSVLYERPWFLLCGINKSGKSSLIRGSGLHFPLRYPSEKDGLLVEGSNQVVWYFANDAVWIDTPGSFMEASGSSDWEALIAALNRLRARNPADGVVIVVNIKEVLYANDQEIKDLAGKLRDRIDELIAFWGIEFPVYLLFNHTDEIPGFREYFADQITRGTDSVFGATIPPKQFTAIPAIAFQREFDLLCISLTRLRIEKLLMEPSEPSRRMICRFTIHFEGVQRKLGALITELFRSSNYGGKPLFRGFYFTSCSETSGEDTSLLQCATDRMTSTILKHPLNPNRSFLQTSASRSTNNRHNTNVVRSMFVLPLFSAIMTSDKVLARSTRKRFLQTAIRHYCITAAILLCGMIMGNSILRAHRKAIGFKHTVESVLSRLPPKGSPLVNQYYALDTMHSLISMLQNRTKWRLPLFDGFGLFHKKTLLAELEKDYLVRLHRYITLPAAKYLEHDLQRKVSLLIDIDGDTYDTLYRTLKAYLSLSEGGPRNPNNLDTIFLRGSLFDAVKHSFLAVLQKQRLPPGIESVIDQNLDLYLYYLCNNRLVLIQEDHHLVELSRNRLSHPPSPVTLYENIINRLVASSGATYLDLNSIVRSDNDRMLRSPARISTLYTNDGWNRYVSKAINELTDNPFKVDWVVASTNDTGNRPVPDVQRLKEEMTVAYLDDFKLQWLEFLASIEMVPFANLLASSQNLRILAGESSETTLLLKALASFAAINENDNREAALDKTIATSSKIKAMNTLTKTARTLQNNKNLLLAESPAFERHQQFFNHLNELLQTDFPEYKKNVSLLAESCSDACNNSENNALTLFNGNRNDPLLNGYRFTQTMLDDMPEELSVALRAILVQPFEHTGSAVEEAITILITNKWDEEIVKPFTRQFSGRYPFIHSNNDASFKEVMDFFRPLNGTFWGFYERNLSGFMVKQGDTWETKHSDVVLLHFNPELYRSLEHAEKIKNLFFKIDGTPREFNITVVPSISNRHTAELILGNLRSNLELGGKPVQLRWPYASDVDGATLKVTIDTNFTREIAQNGSWGFMKLLKEGNCKKINRNSFSVRWHINIQNHYTVFYNATVQVTGADHPFCDNVFETFSLPHSPCISQKKQ